MDKRSQIDDFLNGRLSEPQAKEMLEWLHSAEGEEFLSAQVDRIWVEELKNLQYQDLDSEALWKKTTAKNQIYAKSGALKSSKKPRRAIPAWLKVAGSFLIGVVALWVLRHSFLPTEYPTPNVVEVVKTITKNNPPGQKTKIHLPDGSIVYLNSDSQIDYPTNFANNRKIFLEGEAFFFVSKDSAHPFQVVAKGITTTALGTSFNVSTFTKDNKVKITLITGKVKLNKEGKKEQLILNPGEESIISKAEKEFQKNQVDVNHRILWIDGIINFEKTPILEVLAILERWYGVKVKVQGNVNQTLCSGTFQNNELLKNVLNVLSSSVGFDYQLRGKEVVIDFK